MLLADSVKRRKKPQFNPTADNYIQKLLSKTISLIRKATLKGNVRIKGDYNGYGKVAVRYVRGATPSLVYYCNKIVLNINQNNSTLFGRV